MNWKDWGLVALLTLLLTISFDDAQADEYFLSGVRSFVVGTVPYEENYDGFREYEEARQKGAKCYDMARYIAEMVESRGTPPGTISLIVVRVPYSERAHTVVGVEMDRPGDPYIVDLNSPFIKPLSQRSDLEVDVVVPWR